MIQKNFKHANSGGAGGGAVWFFGFVGALIYFLQNTNGLGEVIIGILKAIVWPAYFVYHILTFLNV